MAVKNPFRHNGVWGASPFCGNPLCEASRMGQKGKRVKVRMTNRDTAVAMWGRFPYVGTKEHQSHGISPDMNVSA